jgi:hypothetical protein
VYAFATSRGSNNCNEIGLGVENRLVRAGIPNERRFFLGGHRRKDASTFVLQELDQQQTDAARPGVNQHIVAGFNRVCRFG